MIARPTGKTIRRHSPRFAMRLERVSQPFRLAFQGPFRRSGQRHDGRHGHRDDMHVHPLRMRFACPSASSGCWLPVAAFVGGFVADRSPTGRRAVSFPNRRVPEMGRLALYGMLCRMLCHRPETDGAWLISLGTDRCKGGVVKRYPLQTAARCGCRGPNRGAYGGPWHA